jgi:hypothetical protein
MAKVTSTKDFSFPKLGWGISAGETKELPEGEAAQKRILMEPEITKVGGSQAAGEGKADTKNKAKNS